MRECGNNFCVSTEEGLYGDETYKYQDKNLCPISRIQIASRTCPVATDLEGVCFTP